ncbi:MAG: UDP-N-acetylmuramoyl-L-alanyl-D-glutamate--2,6-diaminopimelate ligase [Actinobacteria bacterium]|nr:UDP-N-acetylmuramoyl-L-alanyl-D-glutamate--2,6-diaminopimelate ligase [Actinomycetota bacterium]
MCRFRSATPSPEKIRPVPCADVPIDPATTIAVPRPAHPTPVRLGELAARCGLRLRGAHDRAALGITASSRAVRDADIFAALPGEHVHGARFVDDAVTRGAVAVLTDPAGAAQLPSGAGSVPTLVTPEVRAALGPVAAEIYGRPSGRLRVVGITGTSGKTTTSYLSRAALAAAARRSGLIGTVATMIGEQEIQTGFTTPEAPDIQALLAVMVEREVSDVVMEVSSHALTFGRADGIDFTMAAFTNLSQDHLDVHGDMENYFAAKARLFDGRAARAIVVVDDDWGRRLAALAGSDVVTISATGRAADWRAEAIRLRPGGSRFRAVGPGVDVEAGSAIPGAFNVTNALLALAIATESGIPAEVAAAAIADASVPGRMERIEAGQRFVAVVDYSHKPAAVEGALRALRPMISGKLIVVLGCGGDRDRAKRPVMGRVAAEAADLLVVTDDNPRSEDPAEIRSQMLSGARAVPPERRARLLEVGERADAIAVAVAEAGPGDAVLVAGKGHESGQEVAGVVRPFDDRLVLRRAIEASIQAARP